MSKYHNRKVEIDGIKFDSTKEGERYLGGGTIPGIEIAAEGGKNPRSANAGRF